MKIAINCLSAKIGGGITYLQNIVPLLIKHDNKNKYFLVVSSVVGREILGAIGPTAPKPVLITINTDNILFRLFAEQILLPLVVLKNKIDLLYCPANIVPFLAPCRKLLWIQNIDPFIEIKGESMLVKLKMKILRAMTIFSMKHSDAVVFSSDYSKALVLAALAFTVKNVRTIPLGVISRNFRPEPRSVREDYILSVSNISNRKNYDLLIRAYSKLKPEISRKYRLLIAGRIGKNKLKDYIDEMNRNGLNDRIIFMGELHGEELYSAYKKASMFVFPSLVESFGLPLLEAMAAGLPVLAANSTAIPDVVGNAGELFDPTRADDLANRITALIENIPERMKLALRAQQRAELFSWENTAKAVLSLFDEIFGRMGPK